MLRKLAIPLSTAAVLAALSAGSAVAMPVPPSGSAALSPATVATGVTPATCSRYPASVYTTTRLTEAHRRFHPRRRNWLHVHVRSLSGVPQGTALLRIWRGSHLIRRTFRVLVDGRATFKTMRHARPALYHARVHYVPRVCSKWKASNSNTVWYRVYR